MKSIFTIFFLSFTITLAFSQTQKTLVKSFNLEGATTVITDLGNSEVKVETWNNETMRVQLEVSLENANENTLKMLVAKGRYNVYRKSDENGNFVLFAPRLKESISTNGENLKEQVVLTIFVPDYVAIKNMVETAQSTLESSLLKF